MSGSTDSNPPPKPGGPCGGECGICTAATTACKLCQRDRTLDRNTAFALAMRRGGSTGFPVHLRERLMDALKRIVKDHSRFALDEGLLSKVVGDILFQRALRRCADPDYLITHHVAKTALGNIDKVTVRELMTLLTASLLGDTDGGMIIPEFPEEQLGVVCDILNYTEDKGNCPVARHGNELQTMTVAFALQLNQVKCLIVEMAHGGPQTTYFAQLKDILMTSDSPLTVMAKLRYELDRVLERGRANSTDTAMVAALEEDNQTLRSENERLLKENKNLHEMTDELHGQENHVRRNLVEAEAKMAAMRKELDAALEELKARSGPTQSVLGIIKAALHTTRSEFDHHAVVAGLQTELATARRELHEAMATAKLTESALTEAITGLGELNDVLQREIEGLHAENLSLRSGQPATASMDLRSEVARLQSHLAAARAAASAQETRAKEDLNARIGQHEHDTAQMKHGLECEIARLHAENLRLSSSQPATASMGPSDEDVANLRSRLEAATAAVAQATRANADLNARIGQLTHDYTSLSQTLQEAQATAAHTHQVQQQEIDTLRKQVAYLECTQPMQPAEVLHGISAAAADHEAPDGATAPPTGTVHAPPMQPPQGMDAPYDVNLGDAGTHAEIQEAAVFQESITQHFAPTAPPTGTVHAPPMQPPQGMDAPYDVNLGDEETLAEIREAAVFQESITQHYATTPP